MDEKDLKDFEKRAREFKIIWEKEFSQISKERSNSEYEVEINLTSREKRLVSIHLSTKMLNAFSNAQKDSSANGILDQMTNIMQDTVGGKIFQVNENSVIVRGESGIAYASCVLSFISFRIRNKIEKERKKKSNKITSGKAIVTERVREILASCETSKKIEFNVFYKKGLYYIIIKSQKRKNKKMSLKLEISDISPEKLIKDLRKRISELCKIIA